MNITKENHIITMHKAIDACKGKTAYSDEQIEKMKSDGEKIFNEIFAYDGTTVVYDDGSKEKEVKIEKYVFGHNDFQIHLIGVGNSDAFRLGVIYCSDYLIKKAIKEIFYELKKEDKELGIKTKIGHQGTDGYGTAFILSYDLN